MKPRIVCAAVYAFLGLLNPARADVVEDYYKGKELSFIIGFDVGGG